MYNNPLILYAPNVHIGGGFELLKELLNEIKIDGCIFIFDIRIKDKLINFPPSALVYWIKPSVTSRLYAEILLSGFSKKSKLILCFHGLPPLFKQSSKNVIVYFQNRLLIERGGLRNYSPQVRLRILAERFISKFFRNRVSKYFVQTKSMKSLLEYNYGNFNDIEVIPFVPNFSEVVEREKKWHFIYPADGLPHKNHKKLIEAWILLSLEGINPSLLITIDDKKFKDLYDWVDDKKKCHHINLTNIGWVDRTSLTALYESSHALIFPSKKESFGLPLLEARHTGLKILASELDYVRDVVEPDETFDPDSAVSIARAVKRSMSLDATQVTVGGGKIFISELLRYV